MGLYKILKEKMSRMGFYSVTDYAKLTGVSRQAIHSKILSNKVQKTTFAGHEWINYDNGEHSVSVYGAVKQPLTPFINFGFVHRLKSLIIGDRVVCDIKNLDGSSIAIRFYNQEGQMLQVISNLSTLEIITDSPN